MMPLLAALSPTLVNGFVLGWSVAWPPGPVNAEMIRRGLLPRAEGGGFWVAWQMGLGACSGDFLWALGVTLGAGALLNTPGVRTILGIVSLILLLFLATTFARGAWRAAHAQKQGAMEPASKSRFDRSNGYLLGFTLALTSPWNIGFWLAVVGSQQTGKPMHTVGDSLALAGSVVLGAITWTIVLCSAVRQGARIFAKPSWQIATQALTAAVMIFFAVRLVIQLGWLHS